MALKLEHLLAIRELILRRGDRQTYCNMYNHNPHFAFSGFDVFLNPDAGQRNINCDPALSGFDELVIREWDAHPIYLSIVINRGEQGLQYAGEHQRRLERYVEVMLAEINRGEPDLRGE